MNEEYFFSTPLNSHFQKYYYEFQACKLLEYCYPQIGELICSDKPDLQTNDQSLGIEVAAAMLTQDAIVAGEFTKYEFGKKDVAARNRCLETISTYGGNVSEFCLSFPSHSLDDEFQNYRDLIIKKIHKLPLYRAKGYRHMGLFIMCSSIPIPFRIETLKDIFVTAQQSGKDKFDYIWLGYSCAVLFYDEATKQISIHKIPRDTYDQLAMDARVEIETKYMAPSEA